MDLVILNHGQVTRTTPKIAPLSPHFHTTPVGGRLRFYRFNGHHPPTWRVFSGTWLELMTRCKPVTGFNCAELNVSLASKPNRHSSYLLRAVLSYVMEAVDFLHHENPPIWAGVKPAFLGAEEQ
ncbi:hypothetical protein TNCV_500751 [Trichonephila clavipes]|nr:hypothetical protein TNCV_500751 [Trichonephila clavipes]